VGSRFIGLVIVLSYIELNDLVSWDIGEVS
jgi:hypothetical protein